MLSVLNAAEHTADTWEAAVSMSKRAAAAAVALDASVDLRSSHRMQRL